MSNPASEPETAFDEQRVAIHRLLARATIDEIATRYQVGLRLLVLMGDPEKYGGRAVERLAEQLGVTSATLYRYSAVAETWTGHDVQVLIARSTPNGEPLSWLHLVALTRVPTAALRAQLTEECLLEGWSVRELTLRVQRETGRALRGDEANAEPVDVAIAEGIENAARASVQLAAFVEAFAERLDAEAGDEALLSRAIETFEELSATVASALESMREASRSSEMRLKVANRVGPAEPRKAKA
jgi:hypothetical protein